ncbi:MAG TPA: hypothetical protein VKA26_13200 [Ignavibacteriaceae bacterium]|nr:hypothetical protein [Ignavibacteriaceae bacterium]
MKKNIYVLLVIFETLILFAGSSLADRRYFGRLYLANTLPRGAFELELWNTGRFGKYDGFYYRFQPRLEFEYGVTDRLSASMYFNFNQVKAENNSFSSKPFDFESTSIELKYRFTNPGDTFIDPAAYLEVSYGGDKIEYESKLIFSKRYGSIVTAVNLASEIEREIIDSKNESSFELTAGVMYDISPKFAAGLEFRNHRNYNDIYKGETNQATYIGPTINYQADKFYITVNVLRQVGGSPAITDNLDLLGHEKYEFRTILGIDLD